MGRQFLVTTCGSHRSSGQIFGGEPYPLVPPVIDAIVYVIGRRGDDVINTCALKSVADQSGQTTALVAAGSVLTDAALRAAATLRITLVEIYVRPDQCHVTRSRDNRCALQFTHVNTILATILIFL